MYPAIKAALNTMLPVEKSNSCFREFYALYVTWDDFDIIAPLVLDKSWGEFRLNVCRLELPT